MEPSLAETFAQMLTAQLPNLFRLYSNPYVVQTCLCLERYVQTTYRSKDRYQSFLANSFDEALSGAIKLARFAASLAGKPTRGLIIDSRRKLGPFCSTSIVGGTIEFIPGLTVVASESAAPKEEFGYVVSTGDMVVASDAIHIACVTRAALLEGRNRPEATRPDIVVFDESFVDHAVPFGAFTATQALYSPWNKPGKSAFHSTTYQPNTVSTLQFMNCIKHKDPAFYASLGDELRLVESDPRLRLALLRRLYSPSLASAIAMTGFDRKTVTASGPLVMASGTKIFDAVGGVACSVRGHNPSEYLEEMKALASVDCEAEVVSRLQVLTGLANVLPAVSGASAVESALKLALAAQFPRRHVLALKSGFGGKTLFALTGTWNASYKQHIDPLYAEVLYVDPFADDALVQIDAALGQHPVAVVQIELIQGVGGVRRVPEHVVRHLEARREKHGYLLLVDEVQTGMHRTGPFTFSSALGIKPDLLVMGKAVSDMMFPFALTLYSAAVQRKLDCAGSDLPAAIRERHNYPDGFRTTLNVLRLAEHAHLAERVREAGELFERCLREELASCQAVREVRVYGLLIGIELDASRWPKRWLKKKLFWFYLSAMLRHPTYPVLVGFCQYEPNVLKITPPLTVDAADIRRICATIGEVLRRPFLGLLAASVGSLLTSVVPWRTKHEHDRQSGTSRPGSQRRVTAAVPSADEAGHR